ncbi:redoxin domain-containing protein [Paludibacter sp.]|uniref:redoxin domain-containing protein n=1 Tax=Paludibacter sp. TaxID=1898105 RepID=UPI001352ACC9|nr:redoxin domain-containing protein [Paludibacter sp.]MTK52678.1 redoxin domain-containing protein [Paludibacter sp.]
MLYKNSIISFLFLIAGQFAGASQDVNIKIHVNSVFDTKISLLPLAGAKAYKPVVETGNVKNGESTIILIPKDYLPGQFVLRFDYRDKESSTPYPSEKYFFANEQSIELWVNPKAIGKPDSTYFQKGELENSLYDSFMKDNSKKREQVVLLQNFLLSYDQPHSEFFKMGTKEFEARRNSYNKWIDELTAQHSETFVSKTFGFQKVQPINWNGTETERVNSFISHYFDESDFQDPLIIKTPDIKDWMNKYVNLYGAMATNVALRDSLFTLAGKMAIEKAKNGHPLVYGWMVDYFYKGYEGFNISKGMQMLQPYLEDPRCLTSKRLEIERRLQGIETIRPGAVAPDFMTTDATGKQISFLNYKTNSKYKLVLFWSADCQHCKELMQKLYPWYLQVGGKRLMEVFAISVDYTATEIKAWEEAKPKLAGWKHSKAEGGINSPEANAYFILSTPVMILVDAKTNKIVALPEKVEDLEKAIAQ